MRKAYTLLLLVLTVSFAASLCRADSLEELEDFYYEYEESECLRDEGSPCQNGGRCVDEWGSYTCVCPLDFTGKDCDVPVNATCFLKGCGSSGECVFQESVGRPMCQCSGTKELSFFCEDQNEPVTPPSVPATTTTTVAPPTTTEAPLLPPFAEGKFVENVPQESILIVIITAACAIACVTFVGIVWFAIRTCRKRRERWEAANHPSEPPSPKTVITVA